MHLVRMVVEVQLDGNMSRREVRRQLGEVARIIEYHQRQRERAARSHRKRRLRLLRSLGIFITKLRKCFDVF